MSTPDTVLSVSDLNRQVRQRLESGFPLLWIGGEISNLVRAASGHLYFSLKDANAQVRCVMYRARAARVDCRLENGQQVEAQALVGLYEPRGEFQLNIEFVRRAGLGQRFEALARLTARLAAEGLLAAERKRPLPAYPRGIAVVTSPQAAALHDVQAALARRAPHVPARLYPVPVQGDGAAAEIAAAITAAGAAKDIDVVLVVRGGGSLEDLWAFNEESVVRAIAGCGHPVVSGIGHETDTTLADHAADRRAATPTAAAEIVTQAWLEARACLESLEQALQARMQQKLDRMRQRLDQAAVRLLHPAQQLDRHRDRLRLARARLRGAVAATLRPPIQRLALAEARLQRTRPDTDSGRNRLTAAGDHLRLALRQHLSAQRHRLTAGENGLRMLNPEAILQRGYAIVRTPDGQVVSAAATLHPGADIEITLARGSARAKVTASDSESVVSPAHPD